MVHFCQDGGHARYDQLHGQIVVRHSFSPCGLEAELGPSLTSRAVTTDCMPPTSHVVEHLEGHGKSGSGFRLRWRPKGRR